MKTYFDAGATMEFTTKGMLGSGHTITISKDGFHYQSLNGKVNVEMPFAEIGSMFLTNYCNQNFSYRVLLRDLNMKNMSVPELELDTKPWNNGHNIREIKPLLIAFAASKLGAEFPNNLDSLDVALGATLAEKIIRISKGVIVGAKHQVPIADIKRVKCVCTGALGALCVYTKLKGGFFDAPDMKLPINEITMPLLEAIMTRNTGEGIDLSRGNGFDQKNSDYIAIRYMDSGFFLCADGSVREPWQQIAYNRVKSYDYDVNAHWSEKMG